MSRYRKPILLAVVGLLAFYLVPWTMYTQSNVDAADKRAAEARRNVEERQGEIDAARSINRVRLEEQRTQLVDLMPPEPDLKATIDRLVELADEAGVRWEQSSVTTPVEAKLATTATTAAPGAGAPGAAPGADAGGLTSYNLGIQISGRQSSVLGYLEKVRSVKRLVLVQSLQVSFEAPAPASGATATTAASEPSMRATMELRVYSYRGLSASPPTTKAGS